MPFQVLTGQWSKIFTHKFRVAWNDLTPINSANAFVQLDTIPRAVEIVGVKIWLRTTFDGPAITACEGYVMGGIDPSIVNLGDRAYGQIDLLQPASDYSGILVPAQDRINMSVSPQGNYISNQNGPNDLFFVVQRNGGAPFPQLTAGEVDIWIMTMKLP